MATRPTLTALLRTRSRRDVATFLAALYAARGATTRVESDAAVVDGDRYLVVGAGALAGVRSRFGASRPSPDVVVTVDPGRADRLEARYDAPTLTPADLDDLARYGLDRAVADRVFGECFDRVVADVAPPTRPADERPSPGSVRGGSHDERSSRTLVSTVPQTVAIAVLLVASLVAFGAAASPAVEPALGSLADLDTEGGDAGAPGAAPGDVGVANEPRPTTVATATPTPDALGLAPGLSIERIVDARALADAHARSVSNRSYTWELTYVEYAGGNESGRATEVVRVASPTVYTSHVTTDGFLSSRGPVSSRSSYADGERRYQPTAGGVESAPVEQRGPTGPQAARASQYYGVLLDAEQTSVVRTVLGEPRLYVVDIEGAGSDGVRNYTATAHVQPNGRIVYYTGSYCYVSFRGDDTRETCLSLTMQYRNVGQTTVEPPTWYTADRARRAG
jgi:hypothetical protein